MVRHGTTSLKVKATRFPATIPSYAPCYRNCAISPPLSVPGRVINSVSLPHWPYPLAMRLFRAVHTNPPILRDMQSTWDLGSRRPVKVTAANVRAYQGVSVFTSFSQLRDRALAYPKIGHLAAELEVPDGVSRHGPRPDGHVRLDGTTPDQLLGYVVAVRPLFPGKTPSVRK
jgi:hypothetical protein